MVVRGESRRDLKLKRGRTAWKASRCCPLLQHVCSHLLGLWTWKCSELTVCVRPPTRCVWELPDDTLSPALGPSLVLVLNVLTDPNRTVPSGSFLSPRAVFVPRHVFLIVVIHRSFSFIFNELCSFSVQNISWQAWLCVLVTRWLMLFWATRDI